MTEEKHDFPVCPHKSKRLCSKRSAGGEITRKEIEEQTGETVSFGTLLGQLHEHHLPLPRVPVNPQSPGVQLIKRLAEREPRAG